MRDDSPQGLLGTVQQFLHDAMRAVACRARRARSPARAPAVLIEINPEADKMYGRVLPSMRNRVTFAIDLNRLSREQAPIAQFREKRQQPALPRQRRPHVLLRQLLPRRLKGAPRAQQPVPRAVNSLVQFLRLEQVIAIRSQPLQIRVERSNAR